RTGGSRWTSRPPRGRPSSRGSSPSGPTPGCTRRGGSATRWWPGWKPWAAMAKRNRRDPDNPEARRTGARASERLRRLLVVVPYIVANPGVRLAELSRLFGVSEAELVDEPHLL